MKPEEEKPAAPQPIPSEAKIVSIFDQPLTDASEPAYFEPDYDVCLLKEWFVIAFNFFVALFVGLLVF